MSNKARQLSIAEIIISVSIIIFVFLAIAGIFEKVFNQ